jgi:hypothetical protein
MNYSNKNVGPFFALRAAAKYFGLVEYKGDYISLTDDYINILLEKSDDRKKEFVRQAVLRPTLYSKLFGTFGGKQLPELKDLAVRLHIDGKYGISREASRDAAQVFIESIQYAGLLDDRGYLLSPEGMQELKQELPIEQDKEKGAEAPLGGKQAALLDRYEFTLGTGEKILLALPPAMLKKDKNRLTVLIELIPDIEE